MWNGDNLFPQNAIANWSVMVWNVASERKAWETLFQEEVLAWLGAIRKVKSWFRHTVPSPNIPVDPLGTQQKRQGHLWTLPILRLSSFTAGALVRKRRQKNPGRGDIGIEGCTGTKDGSDVLYLDSPMKFYFPIPQNALSSALISLPNLAQLNSVFGRGGRDCVFDMPYEHPNTKRSTMVAKRILLRDNVVFIDLLLPTEVYQIWLCGQANFGGREGDMVPSPVCGGDGS